MKEEKKQRVRYLQKWKIRYFLPKLTIPSCVHSLMQHQLSREGGEDGWAPSLKGWHPSAPPDDRRAFGTDRTRAATEEDRQD